MSSPAGAALRPGWSLHVLPAIVYLVIAFVSGSLPNAPMGPVEFQAKDKVIHLLGFWLMQWTHARAYRHLDVSLPEGQVLLRSWLSATLAGGLLEAWQFFLPHRTADLMDWIADGLGALLGVGFSLALCRMRGAKRAEPRP